jgi:peptide/nickel transport system permease protein
MGEVIRSSRLAVNPSLWASVLLATGFLSYLAMVSQGRTEFHAVQLFAVPLGYLLAAILVTSFTEHDSPAGLICLLATLLAVVLFSFLETKATQHLVDAAVSIALIQALAFLIATKRAAVARSPFAAKLALVVLLVYLFVAVAAPVVSPFGESEIVGGQYEPWSGLHLLGTDNVGRDMLSRLIFGARNTIAIAVAATVLAFVLGGMAGLFAAFSGGWVDEAFGRLVDVLMSIPQLIFALLLLTVAGTSTPVLILTIAVIDATRVFRLVRSTAANVLALEYVEAARLRREGFLWIVGREVLPNIVVPLAVEFGIRFCFVFLFISSLSFLGLGIQPPSADWGSMVRENATLISYGDITPLLPAAAIAGLAISINLMVDWFLERASGAKR